MKHLNVFFSGLCFLLLHSLAAKAQNACDNVTPFVSNICLESSVAVGTQTELGEIFTWYKDGQRRHGPLSGNGSAISYDFAVNTNLDAGIYTIERSVNGGPATCANKIEAVIVPLPLPQLLSGGGYICNGFKTLRLTSSQAGVYYEFLRDGNYSGYLYGTGGPLEFTVYTQGVFSVRASFQNTCSQSYRYFGSEVVIGSAPMLKVTDVGITTASLQWPGTGNHIVEYGLTGFTPGLGTAAGAGGTVINTNAAQTLLTGLTAGKGYDVYVRVPCEDAGYSSNVLTQFTTGCTAQAVFPLTENFESVNGSPLPSCWTMLDVNQDGQLQFSVGSGGVNGTNAVLVPLSGDMLVLPSLALSGNKRLRYKIRSTSYYPEIFHVKLSTGTNTAASYTTLLRSDTLAAGGFEEKTINLTGYTGTVQIALIGLQATYSSSYNFYIDDVIVENIPACTGAGNVKAELVSPNAASFSWQGSGSFIVEYGPPGFTPGNAATAGVGGSIITTNNNFATINGLATYTTYDLYVRQNCTGSGNGYSANSGKLSFTSFLNCANAINIAAACSTITATVTAGTGLFSFNGVYPNNSCGRPTAGKELLYSFTPTTTGVYYLEIISPGNVYVNHFYKPANAGCNNKSWIGIHSNYAGAGKYAIGNLAAATTYYFLFDSEFEQAYTQTFRICRADVTSSLSCSGLSMQNTVPPHSSKKEYLLDAAGGLVAELDFAQVSSTTTLNNSYVNLNTNNIRRDFANKEYLDRSFYFNAADSLKGTLGVKFYFKNAELNRLINEPNDGNADVGNIQDLNASVFGHNSCGGFTGLGTALLQTGNAVYDVNNSSISFSQSVNDKVYNYYFHAGNSPLTADTSIEANLCPGSSAFLSMNDLGAGYSYQWQVNSGTGFTNISNGELYAGTQSRNLAIIEPPTSFYGYKFRCVATNGGTNVPGVEKLLRFSIQWTGNLSDEWLQPGNWSCGQNYRIPDANTDVLIPLNFSFDPVINTVVSCRSMKVEEGATLNMGPAGKLNITGR